MKYQIGKWYESAATVRAEYGEYWKGILISSKQTAVIINYHGARRGHYADFVDIEKGTIQYVGEGKKGDQTLNPRNKRLVQAAEDRGNVHVFFDCGDIFSPKHLLYMGAWRVTSHRYRKIHGRKCYEFIFKSGDSEIMDSLRFLFGTKGIDRKFEAELRRFAPERTLLYTKFKSIMRARDSIAGEIGEYFAISRFNQNQPTLPLIRLRGSTKDIDAVQIKTGKRYAIKTIGKFPGTTSNIWSKKLMNAVDYFLIVHLHPDKLEPIFILEIKASKLKEALRNDNHQGSQKINVTEAVVSRGKLIYGKPQKKTTSTK